MGLQQSILASLQGSIEIGNRLMGSWRAFQIDPGRKGMDERRHHSALHQVNPGRISNVSDLDKGMQGRGVDARDTVEINGHEIGTLITQLLSDAFFNQLLKPGG